MSRPKVVIIGGGFGGLNAARRLKGAAVDVTLVDRSNHHLFQPLLYQVATATVASTDITVPIRFGRSIVSTTSRSCWRRFPRSMSRGGSSSWGRLVAACPTTT